jgi:2-keto-4-pentenoate hydratase
MQLIGRDMQALSALAARQLADYDRHQPGMMFTGGLELSESEAYAVQAHVAALRQERGETQIGFKVGCTSPTIQQQLGIDHPVYGRLWASERYPSGAKVRFSDFVEPAIEGELAVELASDLDGEWLSSTEIRQAIGCVFSVIELHNAVFRGPKPSAAELIANNALHAGFAEAAQRSPFAIEPAALLEIQLDGQDIDACGGRGLTEGVIRSLRWLAAELSRDSQGLKAGQIVLTGSQTQLIPIPRPTNVVVATSHFGRVEVRFVADRAG